MEPMVGRIILVVYAVLLAVGGWIGYRRAGSRPSLTAGIACALVALVCTGLSVIRPGFGFLPAILLGLGLFAFFGTRFTNSGKFMPSGLLALVSLTVGILMLLGLVSAST